MKITVLIKEVPDTYGNRKVDLATGLTDRAASERVMDEICERALEAALSYADGHSETEVTVLCMGPETTTNALRRALSMGAAKAIQVTDPGLAGADLGLTARTIAAALRQHEFDLVLTGSLSTDGSGGMLAPMIAEHLDMPCVSGLSSLDIVEGELSGTRATESGTQTVRVSLPAVASVTEALPEARFPNFKGIVAAKKKPLDTINLSVLNIDAEDWSTPYAIVLSGDERPVRAGGIKIVDEGDAGQQIADFLVSNRLS